MVPTDHGNWSWVGTLLKTLHESCRTRSSWWGTELLFLSVASSFPSYRKGQSVSEILFFLVVVEVSQGMDSLFLPVWGRCFSSRWYKILGYQGKVAQARPQCSVPLIHMQKVSVSVGSPSFEVSCVCFAHNRCSVNIAFSLLRITIRGCQRVEFPFPQPCE